MASKSPLSEDDESEEDVPVDVQIIRKNTKSIIGRIDAVYLLDYFQPSFFTEEEREDIKSAYDRCRWIRAARCFLDILIRKREGWFEVLLEALEHDDLEGRYCDIVDLLRTDRDAFQNECHGISFQEPPEVTGGNMAEPFKPMSTINSQGKTISSDDDKIDLSKKKPVNRKNIAMDNLKEKQNNKNVDVFTKDETGISSDFTRVLTLDEEQTSSKQLWTDGADVTVPFCSPNADQYPHIRSPTSPKLNNLSNVPTNEKKITVGWSANNIGATYERKKDNRLKVSSFKPRKYQVELAERPKEGRNSIICSPTNTGKTYMAIMVTKHHLYEHEVLSPIKNCIGKGQDPKVIVVVPRFALLQQVCRDFRSHMPLYHIGTRSGGDRSKITMSALVDANDIIIVTADILKNALNDNTKLSDFSLLILDECHHTMKDHPYNDIMEAYVSEKLSASAGSLPQVLALTASPGAGKIPDVLSAKNSILRLCANLDAECFITVQKNVDDLSEWIRSPSRQRIMADKRTRDPFNQLLTEWMNRLETDFDLKTTCEKSTQEYESFIAEKEKEMLSDRNIQGTRVCDHLILLNKALILSDSVRMTDGVNLVQRFYEELETRTLKDTETWLHAFYKANTEGLRQVASLESRYPNPKLEELRHEILSHNDSCNLDDVKLRVMVFVKTKEITQTMLEWMKDDEKLKEFNPSPFTGVRGDVEKGGMSKQQQKDVLSAFEKGDHQILISTSAGEEGIDIPECTGTIRYNHVTDEKSMIQSRGRVRRSQGREVILGESDTLEKDSKNVLLEEVMVEAMKEVTAMSTEKLTALTTEIQRDAFEERQQKINKKMRLKNLNEADSVKLYCKGCEMFVCMASDLRIYSQSSHILVGEQFKELINVVKHHNKEKAAKNIKKIACKGCGYDWGNTVHKRLCYPCLKIVSFFSEIDGQMKSFSSWKQVPYKIPDWKPL